MLGGWHPKLSGVTVRLAWGWLGIVVALLAIAIYERLPQNQALVDLLAWSSLVLLLIGGAILSLAAHDLGHVLISRRQGHPIKSVSPAHLGTLPDTLFDPEDPRSDALIAAAGPVVSAALTIVLGLVWFVMGRPLGMSMSGAVGLLTVTNAILLASSLLPGYPFDGGRLLRAFLWFVIDDLVIATRLVAYYGYALALLGLAGGVALVASGGSRAIWGAFIVLTFWGINRSIVESVNHVFWLETGKRLHVGDVFVGAGRRIRSSTTIDQGIEQLLESHGEAATVVLEEGQVVGVVDLNSIRGIPRTQWPKTTMRDVMRSVDAYVQVPTNAQLRDLLVHLPPGSRSEVLLTRDDGRIIGAINRSQAIQKVREYLAAERLERERNARR